MEATTEPTTPTFVESLRMMADFYEQHPDAPVPYYPTFHVFPEPKDLPAVARAIGSFKKQAADEWFYMTKQFGQIEVKYSARREKICQRVVVGIRKEKVQVPVLPDGVEISYRDEEKDVEIVEWKCPESLLAPEPAA